MSEAGNARHRSRGLVCFERCEDPNRQLGLATALHELDEPVEVVAAVARDAGYHALREARAKELRAPPRDHLVVFAYGADGGRISSRLLMRDHFSSSRLGATSLLVRSSRRSQVAHRAAIGRGVHHVVRATPRAADLRMRDTRSDPAAAGPPGLPGGGSSGRSRGTTSADPRIRVRGCRSPNGAYGRWRLTRWSAILDNRGVNVVEHANEVNVVAVVLGVVLIMLGAGLARSPRDWRLLGRRVRRGLATRRRRSRRRNVSAALRGRQDRRNWQRTAASSGRRPNQFPAGVVVIQSEDYDGRL